MTQPGGLDATTIRDRQGRKIRDRRHELGLTIHDVAETVGVTEGAIRHYENGRTSPSQAVQVRIAEALASAWSDLFGLDNGGDR